MKMTANGAYHWHKRDNDHEFFFVLSGAFIIAMPQAYSGLIAKSYSLTPDAILAPTRRSDDGGICCGAYVRFWHKADITTVLIHVRFWG